PMPPNAADTYVIMKPRDKWPDPGMSKDDLIRQLEAAASKSPGNKLEFSQPIQMRFNELIAGVRADIAVKVFGDEFSPMLRAANGALQNLPVALPQGGPGAGAVTIPLRQLATFHFAEGPNQVSRDNGKRRVVVTANVRGRDIGSLVDEAQAKIAEQITLTAG